MIRYALICSQHHEFDSWFKNSEAFDRLSEAGEIRCPMCSDSDVRKALMAPAIGRRVSDAQSAAAGRGAGPETPGQPKREIVEQAASLSTEATRKLAALRQEIERTHDYVGPRFAEEARKMHVGEIEHRGIYGEATREEARELADEGVKVTPLPFTIRLDA